MQSIYVYAVAFDPIQLGRATERFVCDGLKRKYYRFRVTRFYGGSVTGDVVGCNLRCVYCWSWRKNAEPWKWGKFYSPEEAARKLINLARKSMIDVIRLSGGEPTLCKDHLLALLRLIPNQFLFILETNGLLIPDIIDDLPRNVFVRVSLKGVDEESFQKITGAEGRYFWRQIEALRLLHEKGIPARPALPVNIFAKEKIAKLQELLWQISPKYTIEPEIILDYGGAMERLRKVFKEGRPE